VKAATSQLLQGFKHRAIAPGQQSLGNMNSVIGVDANQVGVERRVMNLGKWNAVRDDRLAERFVLVGDDVCGIQQQWLWQASHGTTPVVGGDYVGVSPSLFDMLVKDGRMPAPKRINARTVWDRLQLDAAFAALPSNDEPVNPWDEIAA
jgi:hypothetical protein